MRATETDVCLCFSCSLGSCAGFAPALSSWLRGALQGVDCVFFFPLSPFCLPPSSLSLFSFPPSDPLPHVSPYPEHRPPPCISHARVLVLWWRSPLQLSPSTLPPFSTPPAPSPANGPPSPKFGRDPLSYCLKEINKTVKPRISSFRTLRRSVSHQGRRFRVPGDLHPIRARRPPPCVPAAATVTDDSHTYTCGIALTTHTHYFQYLCAIYKHVKDTFLGMWKTKNHF